MISRISRRTECLLDWAILDLEDFKKRAWTTDRKALGDTLSFSI